MAPFGRLISLVWVFVWGCLFGFCLFRCLFVLVPVPGLEHRTSLLLNKSYIPQQEGASNGKGEQTQAKVDNQQNLSELVPAQLPAWVSMGALSFQVSCSPG